MATPPEKEPDLALSNTEAIEVKRKEQDETARGGFGVLVRTLGYAAVIDRTIQIVCVFAALCSGAAMPLMALVLGRLTANFTDFGTEGNQQSSHEFMQSVKKNALWFVYLFIGKFTLVYIWSFGFTFAANRMVQVLRLACLSRILNRSVADHDAQTHSLSNTITLECNSIQAVFSERLGIMIQAFSMLLAAFAVAFTQSWQLTLVMMGLVFLTLALIGVVVGSDQKIEAGLLTRYATCSAIAEDALVSIKTVVAFGAINKFLKKYDNILAQAEMDSKKRGPLVGLMFACQYFFMFTGWSIGFLLGAYLFKHGKISDPGKILAVFFAMLIGLGAIMALGPNMPSIIKAVAASGVIFTILDDEAAENNGVTDAEEPIAGASTGNIEFRNVSFSYQSRPRHKALSNVNLKFARGTSTAVIGSSGAGKSTLISLLERWYEPSSGSVLVDSKDISEVDVKWLRSQIALVQQEPQLFNASIFDNISYGLVGTAQEHASHEKKLNLVKEACRESRAYEFISKLPKDLDTIVGDQGSLISGGQKQRIAIARALIGRRPILLMDEATSALDGENSTVIESLMAASQNRTTLFISHKILTAKRADRIVVLNEGNVAEQGTHEDLIAAAGLYKRLYDTQTHDQTEEPSAGAMEYPINQKLSLAAEHAPTANSSTQLTEIPEIRKRNLFVNLRTIGLEQRRFLPLFFTGVGACIVTAQIFPVQAILLGRVLETFQGPSSKLTSRANFWALMFFIVGIGALLSYAVLGFFMTLLGIRLTRIYRLEYFRAILLQRMEFFDRMASGALVSRLSSDPANLHELISVNMGLLISIVVSLVSSSIIALAFSWKFALVAIFGAMPLVFSAGFIRMKLDSSLAEATTKVFEDSAHFVSDALFSIRTVKAFTMEDTVRQSYEQYLSSTIKKVYRQSAIIMLFFAFSESIELLAAALAFWYGGKLLSDGETTTARFFTVFISVIVGGQAAGALFGFSSNIGKAKIAANNIIGIRQQVEENNFQDKSSVTEESATDAIVEFQNVYFAYPARPEVPILKGISLQIFRGQMVGIVGTSGSGKSTLLALLERFYDPQSGDLNAFGKSIFAHDMDEYRKRLSIVTQEPALYRGSVRDNILLGVDENRIREEDMIQAGNAANLTEFVSSLPEGYDTEIGSKGVGLSGGQKQRVAIARALIRNPEILLLDEPTSALDAESEQIVNETLQGIQKGRTVILVTHRLNTLRNADVIFFMAGGEVVEQGSHSDLMAKQRHYFKMYQSSRGEVDTATSIL